MLWMAERTSPCANARPPRSSTSAASAKPRPTSSRPITGRAANPATTRNRTVSQPLASAPTFWLVSLAACARSGDIAGSAVAASVARNAATSVHTIACLRDGPVTGPPPGLWFPHLAISTGGTRPRIRRRGDIGTRLWASWPASDGDRVRLDGPHVPAVAVHDGQLVAQRPLSARV